MGAVSMAFIVVGAMGLVLGGIIVFAAQKFYVEEDPRIEEITDKLPGANCGACGFAGCAALAESMIADNSLVDKCIPGGKAVVDIVCSILGIAAVASAGRQIAEVRCIGSCDIAANRYEYQGVPDCKAAGMMVGGPKACKYGCLGLGNCASACPFDALVMGENGLPIVDTVKCTGCGVCAKACPRGIIHVVVEKPNVKYVPCNSKDKGKATRDSCEAGCIACKACIKACPNEAISVDDNLAAVDREKCDNCGKCVEACKRLIIKDVAKVSA